MKKLTALTLLAVVLTAVIVSCKKNVTGLFYNQGEAVIGAKNPKLSNSKKPDWEKSNAGNTLVYNYVEIPLGYAHKITPTFAVTKNPNAVPEANQKVIDASFDRLVIYKNKRGKVNQRIISFVPDEGYLAKHKNSIVHNRIDKLDSDFDGYLHYKDWEGGALFVLRIENGRPVKKYNLRNSVSRTIKPSVSTGASTKGKVMVVDANAPCYFVTWDWYQDCYYWEGDTVPYKCDPPVIYNLQTTEVPCPPIGGGDGGGGPGPIDDPELEAQQVLILVRQILVTKQK
ncbi:MAG: hypothetical protein EOO42_16305 [Flavobacteriales bacterium]|nr:MAG: hypothetical protein EOO42_16305 [Flavobacteriales bacterium]